MASLAMNDAVGRLRRVLLAAGLDPLQPMTRVASYSNEVWVGDDVVARINHAGSPGAAPDRLLREAEIAARVTSEVRYPPIIAVGSDPADALVWIVARRARGIQLGRAWPSLAPAARRDSIHQLASALAALHATPIAELPPLEQQPPHTLPLDEIIALIDRLGEDGYDRGLLAEIAAFARERCPAFADVPRCLVHGDPHLENVLWDGGCELHLEDVPWDGGCVSALLDLEWSQAAWVACDLEILLAVAAHPALFAASDYEASLHPADFVDVPRWLLSARPAWFAAPRLLEQLELLLVSRTLGCLDEGESAALTRDPGLALRIVHLRNVLDGASYLRGQLASL